MNNQRPSTLAVGERKNRVVIRGAGKRRNRAVPLSQKVTLDRVLGLTVKDNSALTCDTNTGLVAYCAGCAIVIFNPRKNKQHHIINQSRKTLTAVSFSGDGRYLVSGECGHNPAVRIWDVQDKSQVAELHGHKYGVACVAFSPDMRYVVSVGEQHDMVVNVWDWKKNVRHSSGKIAAQVTGLAFSEDGSSFISVGNRCVKFWYLGAKSKTRQIQALHGRSGILGEQRNNFFCSAAYGKGENGDKVYAITRSGFLCEINSKRLLDKWVEVRTTGAHSIAANEEFVFVACDAGIIRLFNASTLHFIATLPRPHHLGINVSAGIDASHMRAHKDNAQYPDAIAIRFDDVSKKLTCVYNDHSLYMWDVHDPRKIGKHWSFLYHSACIFGVEVYPQLSDGNRAVLPAGSFLTCSLDGTVRIWNVDPAMNTNIYKRNIYSHELLKVLYMCQDSLESLRDKEYMSAGTNEKPDTEKGKHGIRCLRVSPDGQALASGDRSGNVRVHDLQFWDQVHEIEAHDSEVLCLEYTQPNTGFNLLASASRDRLIHVFDMDRNCSLVQTLDDHSSSITSVKFNKSGEQLQMISCGADKALMFRMAVYNPDLQFVRNHHVVSKTTLYDLAIDPTQKYITTACQDRNLRIYNINSGKLKRTYKGAHSDEGTLIRVELDPSGMYAATSCSDKSLSIYDFYSGECVATMMGHSELVTGMKFTGDCKQLISVSGDGCIFVWKLPWELTHNMKERLREMGEKPVEPPPEYNMLRRGTYVVSPELAPELAPDLVPEPKSRIISAWKEAHPLVDFQPAMQSRPDTEDEAEEMEPDEDSEECNFDSGPLPLWAQKQVNMETGSDAPSPTNYSSPTHPRGRWAQSITGGPIKVKSQMELNQSIELRLEDCFDRRRYTVEPDVLLEQGPFAGMDDEEISKICGDEFVPASQKFGVMSEDQCDGSDKIEGFVSTSRGSDPFAPHVAAFRSGGSVSDAANGAGRPGIQESGDGTGITDLEGDDEADEDEEEEEEEEEKDDDAQDKEIIFYPPEEDTSSSPESLKFQVTESTQSLEELAKRHSRHRSKDGSKENLTTAADENSPSKASGLAGSDGVEDEDDVGDSDDDDEEEDEEDEGEEEESERDGDVPSVSPRHKHEAVEPASPSTTPDEEKFLHTNFSFAEKEKAGDFIEQEKFGKCLEQLQSRFASDEIGSGRLSISSRFLSRSQHSNTRFLSFQLQTVAAAASPTSGEELGWSVGEKKLGEGASKSSTESGSATAKPTESSTMEQTDGTAAAKSPDDESEAKGMDTCGSPGGTGALKGVVSASPVAEVSLVDVGGSEDKPTAGLTDENLCASKESSQDSSPESSKAKGRAEEVPAPKDGKTGIKSSVLDEVNGQAADLKAPERAGKESSPSKESDNCDLEDEIDCNKENVSSVSLLNKKTAEVGSKGTSHKPRSGGERSKVPGEEENASNMRRVASLNDLQKDCSDKNESLPVLPISNQSHARSVSSEREKKVTTNNSVARQKRRERAVDRILPLLPNPRIRSYEARTESSIAKAVRRISSDSPPSSPNLIRKRKTFSNSGSPKSGPMRAIDPAVRPNPDGNDDAKSEDSVESSRTGDEGGGKIAAPNATADKLAMPPPSTTHVSKTKPGKKSSVSKLSERGRRRSLSASSSGKSSQGRRASTSSLPPASSESRRKTSTAEGKPTSGAAFAQKNSGSESKLQSTDSDAKLECRPTETKITDMPQSMLKMNDSTKDGDSNLKDVVAKSSQLASRGGAQETVDVTAGNDVVARRGSDGDCVGSESENTVVSETGRAAEPSAGGEAGERDTEKQEIATDASGGGTTPEEDRVMRADLTIDLADITVGDPTDDPGEGLRRSVQAMKAAFDRCVHYVSVIEKRGNHQEELRYFQEMFTTMDRCFVSTVHPVLQRNGAQSPDNTLSDVSKRFLTSNPDSVLAGPSETSRSLPSLSDLLTGHGGARARDRLDRRAGSLDATSPQALALLHHYSDMLVSMVRTKMEDGEEILLSGRSRVSSVDLEEDLH